MNPLDAIHQNNDALEARFADKLNIDRQLNRQPVSFQANKNKPGYRWFKYKEGFFKYKEGFSEALMQHILDYLNIDAGRILDPFAGTGTALFAAIVPVYSDRVHCW